MTAKIIDGKALSLKFLNDVRKKAANVKPGLAIVIVGNNPASEIYVGLKEKKSKEIGFYVERYNLDENVKQDELLKLVDELNQNRKINGFIVQLPLPKHIDENLVIDSILPHKDVDGFTPVSLGNLVNDNNLLLPATARACLELIKSTGVEIKGKNAVVVGRSNIVGKPTALLLLQENATVTVCHSKTKILRNLLKMLIFWLLRLEKQRCSRKTWSKKVQ